MVETLGILIVNQHLTEMLVASSVDPHAIVFAE